MMIGMAPAAPAGDTESAAVPSRRYVTPLFLASLALDGLKPSSSQIPSVSHAQSVELGPAERAEITRTHPKLLSVPR